MRSSARLAGTLLVAGAVFLPSGAALAAPRHAPSAVLLRYGFAPGQSYAYSVSGTVHPNGSMAAVGALLANTELAPLAQFMSPASFSGVIHVRVVRVDEGGGADVTLRGTNLTYSGAAALAGSQVPTSTAPVTVHIGADGSVSGGAGLSIAGLGLQATGLLPAQPVGVGARWTSSANVTLPPALATGIAPVRVSFSNTLKGFITADRQSAATIASTSAPAYSLDAVGPGGLPVHVSVSGTVTGQSVFSLIKRRLISNQSTIDLQFVIGRHHLSLFGKTPRGPHVDITVSARPDGW